MVKNGWRRRETGKERERMRERKKGLIEIKRNAEEKEIEEGEREKKRHKRKKSTKRGKRLRNWTG